MSDETNQAASARHHVSIIDILFAVSIAAGFTVGFYDLRHEIATLAFLRDASLAQAVSRLLLAYVVITVSWFYFHASVSEQRNYSWGEFISDLLVYYTYIMLFIFIEYAPAFYVTLTAVWILYTISISATPGSGLPIIAYRIAFVIALALVTASALVWTGVNAEWLRLAAATVLVIAFRLLDRALFR